MATGKRVIRPLGGLYFGKQVMLGARVAPTIAVPFSTPSTFLANEEWDESQDYAGAESLAGMDFPPELIRQTHTLNFQERFNLRTVGIPLGAALGDATITTPTDADATRLHTWAPSPTGGQVFNPATVQWIEKNAKSPAPDYRTVEASNGFPKSMSLDASGGLVQATTEWMLSDETSAPARVAGLEIAKPVAVSGHTAFIGFYDTWDEMVAGEPAAADVRGLQYACEFGWAEVYRNAGILGYDAVDAKKRRATISGMVLMEPVDESLESEELAHKKKVDLRFVKIRFTSRSDVELTDAGNRFKFYFEVGGAFYHTGASLTTRGESDEYGVGTMGFELQTALADDAGDDRDLYFALQTDAQAQIF